ncbi:ABC transporter permease [candidate division KSB1 bacterium]|nr:ABC transporter permease [candidate division KSB1 bacterium]RQW03902.1 MAG: ABC transporter permease [candidate division KSB1 bacterium]
MIAHYFKAASRNLLKNKLHALVNIFGLTIGIVSFIAIALYITDELSFDKFHAHHKRIYRLVHKDNGVAITPAPLAEVLRNDLPEIEKVVRMWPAYQTVVSHETISFYEEHVYFADREFFDVFSFDLIDGDAHTALAEKYSIILTSNMVHKYFADENPLEQSIIIRDEPYKITGVMQNVPHNSHFHCDFVASFQSLEKFNLSNWGNNMFYTYALLKPNVNDKDLESKLGPIITQYTNDYESDEFEVQALDTIHLSSHRGYEIEANGNLAQIYVFATIALLILLVACVNYMNISTAFAAIRKKEIGVRKAIGAKKHQLVVQFFSESFLLAVIAFAVGLLIVMALLPYINLWTSKNFVNSDIFNPVLIPLYIGIILFTTLVAGSYPALVLSSFKPQSILHNVVKSNKKRGFLRGCLVTFQFSILIALLICARFISNQFTFLQQKNLGFSRDHMIVIPMPELAMDSDIIKHEIEKNPGVLQSSFSSDVPGMLKYGWSYSLIGDQSEEQWNLNTYIVDLDFIDTYAIEIVQGRRFSKLNSSDLTGAFIINEAAMQKYEIENPINGMLRCRGMLGQPIGPIVGVAKDFHYQSLHQKVEPCVLYLGPQWYQYLSVKISSEGVPATLNMIKKSLADVMPNRPFEYYFLDAKLNQLYKAEAQIKSIIETFSIIAILIACLGFFGLASFIAQQKTKEIGIRKVLGATAPGMLFYLNKDLNKWVILANIFAWPLAWYATRQWLQNFAYRIHISLWVFVLAGVIALMIALLTVSWQAMRAATANPVEALRYE